MFGLVQGGRERSHLGGICAQFVRNYHTLALRRVNQDPKAYAQQFEERMKSVYDIIDVIADGETSDLIWLDFFEHEKNRVSYPIGG